MKNLRNLFATITLMAVLMVSASTARAGILMTDNLKGEEPQPCTTETKVDSGILVTFTGILVTFTGILVTFKDEPTTVDCGILVTDK